MKKMPIHTYVQYEQFCTATWQALMELKSIT